MRTRSDDLATANGIGLSVLIGSILWVGAILAIILIVEAL